MRRTVRGGMGEARAVTRAAGEKCGCGARRRASPFLHGGSEVQRQGEFPSYSPLSPAATVPPPRGGLGATAKRTGKNNQAFVFHLPLQAPCKNGDAPGKTGIFAFCSTHDPLAARDCRVLANSLG